MLLSLSAAPPFLLVRPHWPLEYGTFPANKGELPSHFFPFHPLQSNGQPLTLTRSSWKMSLSILTDASIHGLLSRRPGVTNDRSPRRRGQTDNADAHPHVWVRLEMASKIFEWVQNKMAKLAQLCKCGFLLSPLLIMRLFFCPVR